MPHQPIIWKIFAAALAIRWVYVIALYSVMGPGWLMGMDSQGYVVWVAEYADRIRSGSLAGWDWVSVSVSVMPLVSWMWVITQLVFGQHLVIAYVLFQGVVDAATCVIVYWLAQSFRPSFALPAGIAAAINPTQIVIAGLFYTDTMFLFFCALMLLAAIRWLERPGWTWAVILGIALGGASLTRVLVVPWVAALLVFLAIVMMLRRSQPRAVLAQIVGAGAVFALCLSPLIARNLLQYGTVSLTAQSGIHYAFWVAPLVRQAHDGTPWAQGSADMQKRIDAQIDKSIANPFELSRRHGEIAREAILQYGWPTIAKAWLYGAVINLASPALLLSPPVSALPRTGFYDTRGASVPDKIWNFLFRSDNALYAWLLLIGIAGVVMVRLLQLAGASVMLWSAGITAPMLLMAGWVAFILLVNGPVATPKYRLPMEPVFNVMTGAGFVAIRKWWRRRKPQTA